MKKLWIFLLVALVAAAAFYLGRHSSQPAAAQADTQASTAPEAGNPALPAGTNDRPDDANYSPEPVRTFRGPDGRAHIISYDEKNPPDSQDPEQVRKALLSDMQYFPKNIQKSYDLSADDLKAILAGDKAIPDFMMPDPNAAGPPK